MYPEKQKKEHKEEEDKNHDPKRNEGFAGKRPPIAAPTDSKHHLGRTTSYKL